MKNIHYKSLIKIAVVAVIACLAVIYFNTIIDLISLFLNVSFPLILGAIMAFILDIPLRRLESIYFPKSQNKWIKRTRRPVCIVLAFVVLALIILLIVWIVIPEMISCFQFIAGAHLQFQYTYFVCVVFTAGIEEFHFISLADRAVENAEIGDNTPERIENGVENQRLQRLVFFAGRSRDTFDDGLQNLFDTHTRFPGCRKYLFWFTAEQIDYLILYFIDHGCFHINLVDHGNNLQIMTQSQIEVRDGLRLNTLRRIDDQQRPFA